MTKKQIKTNYSEIFIAILSLITFGAIVIISFSKGMEPKDYSIARYAPCTSNDNNSYEEYYQNIPIPTVQEVRRNIKQAIKPINKKNK